jgi:sigma-70-like protein
MFNIAALPAPSVDAGLSKYLVEIRKFPVLKPEQELAYARRWREHGDRDAAYHLVTSHLGLPPRAKNSLRRGCARRGRVIEGQDAEYIGLGPVPSWRSCKHAHTITNRVVHCPPAARSAPWPGCFFWNSGLVPLYTSIHKP